MGLLTSTSLAADTSAMTISLWARVPTLAGIPTLGTSPFTYYRIPLIEFGEFDDSNSYVNSGVWLLYATAENPFATDPSQYPRLVFSFAGAGLSLDYLNCLHGNWDFNATSRWTRAFDYANPFPPPATLHANAGVDHFLTTYGTSWFPNLSNQIADSQAFALGKWFHCMLALDTSIASAVLGDPSSRPFNYTAPKSACWVNNFNEDTFGVDGVSNIGAGDNLAALVPNLSVLQLLAPGSDFSTPIAIRTVAESGSGSFFPQWQDTGAAGDAGHPGGVATFQIPSFNMALGGRSIGLPAVFNPNYRVEMAEVQIYANQFIDPRVHYGKFVQLTSLPGARGQGTPQDWHVAANTFGPQTFVFTGGKNGFPVNRGTGGAFTKTGTVNNYSPASFRI